MSTDYPISFMIIFIVLKYAGKNYDYYDYYGQRRRRSVRPETIYESIPYIAIETHRKSRVLIGCIPCAITLYSYQYSMFSN